ncbi:MAG TPA: sigma-54 dependent transcriptional regulator [Candidatus Acidoferrales bacterium]|nr:sigma-54 dependent transcriptional regulator [Candidatus Acidoferrales bacterium]
MIANAFVLPSQSATVLVASPRLETRRMVAQRLRSASTVEEAHGGAEALAKLELCGARVLLLDKHLPDLDCCELVTLVESNFPQVEVLIMEDEKGSVRIPPESRGGAVYRLCRELDISDEDLRDSSPALATAAPAPDNHFLPKVIAECAEMKEIARMVRLVARRHTSVLILGETGTGKELIAEAVHTLSPRAENPLITVNCAAIPETLLEAELFGYARGAFTGAVQSRVGKIHAAEGGTIFFDEIGDMPLNLQSKLLRFLENGEVQRLGTSDVFRVDARVLAATNVNLEERVSRGEFREDLYYRLAVFPVELPPLRKRGEDILLLARDFTACFGKNTLTLSADAESVLVAHQWPGNVRELRHVIERACILAEGCESIEPDHLRIRNIPSRPQ